MRVNLEPLQFLRCLSDLQVVTANGQVGGQIQAAGVNLGVTSVNKILKSIHLDTITRGMVPEKEEIRPNEDLNPRHSKVVEENPAQDTNNWEHLLRGSCNRVNFMESTLQLNILKKNKKLNAGRLGGSAVKHLRSAQGVILESRNQVPHPAPCMDRASLPASVSHE